MIQAAVFRLSVCFARQVFIWLLCLVFLMDISLAAERPQRGFTDAGGAMTATKQTGATSVPAGNILVPGNWNNATTVDCYTVVNGGEGYVIGTNTFLDRVKAQTFWVEETIAVTGAYFWFHEVMDAGGHVHFKIWDLSSGQVGNVLASKSVRVRDVTASEEVADAYFVAFDSPVVISGNFLMGFDMSDISFSNLGLYHSGNGEGGFLGLNWEQWHDNRWFRLLETWGLNVDLAIFPVTVPVHTVSVPSVISPATESLLLYPNPASSFIRVESASQMHEIRVLDMLAKVVLTIPVGANAHQIDVTAFKPGIYFIQVHAGDGLITRRVQITP